MPLLHQDDTRAAGGGAENRRSLAEFLGFDASPLAEAAAAPALAHRSNDCVAEGDWRWSDLGSPEVAHSPRAIVPAACFPPRQTTAYSSYSETAQQGPVIWSGESSSSYGITDLVASLKALAMPSGSRSPPLVVCKRRDRIEPWPDRAAQNRAAALPRRASFCGVSSTASSGDVVRWSGALPARGADASGGYSAKLFLGGLPWDLSEHALMNALRHFQPIRVEWPGRELGAGAAPRGYAYVTLESERRVRALLAASRRDGSDWYYRIASKNMRSKEVQVIPWALTDSNWVVGGSVRLEPGRTVFVGALHGMLSASALATIMNDLFGGVVYAGIDTDKHKYPIGSGRVTFNNVRSYVRAISAAYVEIHTNKFTKKVQVNPYLEDSMCSVCNLQQGPYFCREPTCFGYFCRSCWMWQHSTENHKPLMRNSKSAVGNGNGNCSSGSAAGSSGSAGNASGSAVAGRAHSPRQSPAEHRALMNGTFGIHEGTPSPATSGTSEAEAALAGEEAGAEAGAGWPAAPRATLTHAHAHAH